ncbi:MAG: nucleotidyltransferase family protein [Alphaproteobacteria bacterium]
MTAGADALWRRLAAGQDGEGLPATVARRFGDLVGPALAASLLGPGGLDPDTVARSTLAGRFALATQRKWLARIIAEGPPVVVLKGFALAHQIYPDAASRCMGDLDVLVRPRDRDRLIDLLARDGFAFRPLPTPPWGFISTASYMPFASADGACNLDIHIHPDCYPAYRSMTTEAVFAAAVTATSAGMQFHVPCREHALMLCATNAAKDKFGPFAARKFVDAMRLVASGPVDWPTLDHLAAAGNYALPLHAFLRLLRLLGVPAAALPAQVGTPLPWPRRRAFAAVLAEVRELWPSEPGLAATLVRELLLCTEPAVGLHNAAARLRGLIRPHRGMPGDAARLRS